MLRNEIFDRHDPDQAGGEGIERIGRIEDADSSHHADEGVEQGNAPFDGLGI